MADDISSVLRSPPESGLWDSLFTDHPRSMGESYWQHQRHAFEFGLKMVGGGIACLIHAFLPALFVRTASTTIVRLHARMIAMGRIERSV